MTAAPATVLTRLQRGPWRSACFRTVVHNKNHTAGPAFPACVHTAQVLAAHPGQA